MQLNAWNRAVKVSRLHGCMVFSSYHCTFAAIMKLWSPQTVVTGIDIHAKMMCCIDLGGSINAVQGTAQHWESIPYITRYTWIQHTNRFSIIDWYSLADSQSNEFGLSQFETCNLGKMDVWNHVVACVMQYIGVDISQTFY